MFKKIFFLLTIISVMLLFSCKKEMNITLNENALKILDLEQNGKIKESKHKNEFKIVFYPILKDGFIKDGLGFRIDENMERWKVYDDKGYQIVVGTVAANENKLEMFTAVYEKKVENWDLVSLEVGKSLVGKYPKNIIPN